MRKYECKATYWQQGGNRVDFILHIIAHRKSQVPSVIRLWLGLNRRQKLKIRFFKGSHWTVQPRVFFAKECDEAAEDACSSKNQMIGVNK